MYVSTMNANVHFVHLKKTPERANKSSFSTDLAENMLAETIMMLPYVT